MSEWIGRLPVPLAGLLWVSLALGLSHVVAAAGSAAGRRPVTPAAEGTIGGAPHLEEPCPARCVPGKLIFLPCMAVGAKNMAACRQRELEQCRAACARREHGFRPHRAGGGAAGNSLGYSHIRAAMLCSSAPRAWA